MSLCHSEVFHSPALASQGGVNILPLICRDGPVGADYTLIAKLLPQQVADEIAIERIAYILFVFGILVKGNRIVGHHGAGFPGRSVQLKSSL